MRGLILFLLGIVVGGFAMHVCDRRGYSWHHHWRNPEWRERGGAVGNDLSDQLHRWRLDGDDIRADLQRTGEIVREKAAVAGARIADARIAAVIKAKYVLDRDLSARDIRVDVRGGYVTLYGTAPSNELIGKAVALALDTDGVVKVTSHLTIDPRS